MSNHLRASAQARGDADRRVVVVPVLEWADHDGFHGLAQPGDAVLDLAQLVTLEVVAAHARLLLAAGAATGPSSTAAIAATASAWLCAPMWA